LSTAYLWTAVTGECETAVVAVVIVTYLYDNCRSTASVGGQQSYSVACSKGT